MLSDGSSCCQTCKKRGAGATAAHALLGPEWLQQIEDICVATPADPLMPPNAIGNEISGP